MALYTMKCSGCGNEIQVYSRKSEAWHGSCPNRAPRKPPPPYKHTTAK